MVLAAEAGQFDVVVAESVSRFGRNLSDVAALHDRLVFRGVAAHTPATGVLTAIHVGVMGMMAQAQLVELRGSTKRGQLGRVLKGFVPGGLAFGYDVVPPPPGSKGAGCRRINVAQAGIVRRIFTEFSAGKSPRKIAQSLNDESISGPDVKPWIDTTIRGQPERGTGILNNSTYRGEIVWNKCSYVKDPGTGKRVCRINPPSDWERCSVAELRIVDDALWDQVKARQAKISMEASMTDAPEPPSGGAALNRTHRRTFLLSGLLKCGLCGGGYTIMGKDRYGCAARVKSGTCSNSATIQRQALEQRVLGALQDRMLSPELVAEFAGAYADEIRAARALTSERSVLARKELTDVTRKIAGILDAIERGAWSPSLQVRLDELERQKVTAEQAQAPTLSSANVVRLRPDLSSLYQERVAALTASLSGPEIQIEAAEVLRSLIQKVVMLPNRSAPGRHDVEVHGALAAVLSLGDSRARRGGLSSGGVPVSQVSVVAGTGFEPVTFRL